MDLNDTQEAAVKHDQGACMVIAGAGSGKTRVITRRIAHLIDQGVKPWNILAVTFTNKAAREMRSRVEEQLESTVSDLWIGTFHAMFGQLLRYEAEHVDYTSQFSIYDMGDSQSLIKQILNELQLDYAPAQVSYQISQAKTKLLAPQEYAAQEAFDKPVKPIAQVYAQYVARCKAANAMDFDDLLFNTHKLFEQNKEVLDKYQRRFQHVLVDEFQDTNPCQYFIVRMLSEAHQNLYVVGDDAQSIYSFRGATIENVQLFQQDYPKHKLVRLEQNYRSSKTIVEAANALMRESEQIPKKLWTSNALGNPIHIEQCMSEDEEGRFIASYLFEAKYNHQIPYQEMAVLYRVHRQSRAIEDALRRMNVPYIIYGGISFYERKEIKDVIGYLRFIVNIGDEVAFRRIINAPRRGIGEKSLIEITELAKKEGCSVGEIALSGNRYVSHLGARICKLLAPFAKLIENCRALLKQVDAYELTKYVLEHAGLVEAFSGEEHEVQGRKENIEELLSAVHSFAQKPANQINPESGSISAFLQEVSLSSQTEASAENSVRLMTVHNAKGLEFQVVVVGGVEEGFFPSGMAKDDAGKAEERRLFYVALTRAKERLVLSYALSRYQYGNRDIRHISHFIKSLPKEYLKLPQTMDWDSQREPQPVWKSNSKLASPDPTNKYKRLSTLNQSQNESLENYKETFSIGTRIVHGIFGKGEILTHEGGPSPKVRIKFDTGETKVLLLQYAKLRLLET